jgi:hypothetical protein
MSEGSQLADDEVAWDRRLRHHGLVPRTFGLRSSALVGALLGLAAIAAAQDTPLTAPAGTVSLRVVRSGATIRMHPNVRSPRRGTVRVGTRLPFEARVRGEGCPGGEWYRIGTEAYICEALIEPSPEPPWGETVSAPRTDRILLREHAFVASDGTWAYSRPDDYFRDEWAESLGRGFGIAVTDRSERDGVHFVRGTSGFWVAEEDLRYARGSELSGVELSGPNDVGWVRRGGAVIRELRGTRAGRTLRRAGAREVVHVLEVLPHGLLRIEEGVIAARDVQRPSATTRPSEVGEAERWIDVELASQTLVLYEGDRAIFTTLVSTGRARHSTPSGTFRIWVKLAEDGMDDLERTDAESNYLIEAVPWVQYFTGDGVALHAAFWHDDFGRVHSHGCVNLAPRDAARLFSATSPALPDGWDAVLPTDAQPGTLVRVR